MKKLSMGILLLFLVTAFALPSFARGGYGHRGDGGHGYNNSYGWHNRTMTESERADYLDYLTKKNNIYIEFLNGEVAAGRLDRQVADARIVLMNDHLKFLKEGNFEPRKITDAEIQAREAYMQKMNDLEIEYVKKAINDGRITKERGEYIIQRLQERNNYYHGGYGQHRGGYGGPCGYYGRY